MCYYMSLPAALSPKLFPKFTQFISYVQAPNIKHNPKIATFRSAVIPGWGQAYNKKYWKLPIVYAAVGIPAYLFFWNKSWYQKSLSSHLSKERYHADSFCAFWTHGNFTPWGHFGLKASNHSSYNLGAIMYL